MAGPSHVVNSGGRIRQGDIEQGRILWLPPTDRIRDMIDESGGRLSMPKVINSNPKAFTSGDHCDHPIVVLSRTDGIFEQIQFAVVGHLSNHDLGKLD